jgi:hypothetical protein
MCGFHDANDMSSFFRFGVKFLCKVSPTRVQDTLTQGAVVNHVPYPQAFNRYAVVSADKDWNSSLPSPVAAAHTS